MLEKELNSCVYRCFGAAADTRMSACYRVDVDDEHNDALNTMMLEAMMLEVLNRELPVRLPGVTCTIGELQTKPAQLYEHDYDCKCGHDDVLCVRVNMSWGEEEAEATVP